MIHGFTLRSLWWKRDFTTNEFWNPIGHGVNIRVYRNSYDFVEQYKNTGIPEKYKFVLTLNVWDKDAQHALRFCREQGFKIFLTSREPVCCQQNSIALFSSETIKNDGGEYYFRPDLVCASGPKYIELWGDRAPSCITGYPRFEKYLKFKEYMVNNFKKKFGISEDKKMIFFPAFSPRMYKQTNGLDDETNFSEELGVVLEALEKASNDKDKQIVIKLHPMVFKSYQLYKSDGKTLPGLELHPIIQKYLENKSDKVIVVGDDRLYGNNLTQLMYASDIVVGATSTSILEALFLEKPVIHTMIGALKEKDIFGLSLECNNAYSGDDILTLLNSDKLLATKNSKLAKDYLGPVDGKFCERLCEVIKENV